MNYLEISEELEGILAANVRELPKESSVTLKDVFFSAREDIRNPPKGIDISWKFFSEALNGIRPNEFTILCGPTGAGKTTLLASLSMEVIASGNSVFVAPVETGGSDFVQKMISVVSGKPIKAFAKMSDQEFSEIEQRYADIFYSRKAVFSIYDSRVPHKRILCDLLYAHREYGVTVAVIDNLNFLMDISSKDDALTQMDKVVHDFVIFCKYVPIHVVMVMHPRKTDGGRVESEFDIKGSSTAVQEASNVILWNRLNPDQPLSMNIQEYGPWCREMKFCKIRKNGKSYGTKIIYRIDNNSERLIECQLLG